MIKMDLFLLFLFAVSHWSPYLRETLVLGVNSSQRSKMGITFREKRVPVTFLKQTFYLCHRQSL